MPFASIERTRSAREYGCTQASGAFRTVYFGFGLEGVSTAEQRAALMAGAIDYLLA